LRKECLCLAEAGRCQRETDTGVYFEGKKKKDVSASRSEAFQTGRESLHEVLGG
jgi:hypothetical protein